VLSAGRGHGAPAELAAHARRLREFDAPSVRMTVIGDPQGATFIASKFVPENKDLGIQADAATGSG
jgi:hypothetical protein